MATFRICRTVVFFLATACTLGFAPEPRLSSFRKDQQLTVMELAKKMRNKQAELAKKMALAKKQKDGVPGEAKGVTKGEKLSAKEMKEKLRIQEEEDQKPKNTEEDIQRQAAADQQLRCALTEGEDKFQKMRALVCEAYDHVAWDTAWASLSKETLIARLEANSLRETGEGNRE